MLYTKIQHPSFLGSGEEDLMCFYYLYGGCLVPLCGISGTNCKYPFDRRSQMKGVNWSNSLKEEVLR